MDEEERYSCNAENLLSVHKPESDRGLMASIDVTIDKPIIGNESVDYEKYID